MIGEKIRDLITSMNAAPCEKSPQEIAKSLTEVADAIDQLEQRVAKLEGKNTWDDANILKMRTS